VVDNVGGATIVEHKYDGLHRRIVKLKPNGANWDRRDYYYSCKWQVVEERELLNTASKTTVATVPKFQWVWGTRYIDEVILRDENKDGDSDCVDGLDQRLYYAQDANFNVTALIDTAGTVVERVLYDAYGKSTLYNAAWSATQASTLYNNEVLYAGYRFDPESGLYQVRHRHYHPSLGRWVQRDPIRYADGLSLYAYVRSSPLSKIDPFGLLPNFGGALLCPIKAILGCDPYVKVMCEGLLFPGNLVGVHCWFEGRDKECKEFRYEVWLSTDVDPGKPPLPGFQQRGHVMRNLFELGESIGFGDPWQQGDKVTGDNASDILDSIEAESSKYEYTNIYLPVPGPNSNTYIATLARNSGFTVDLPSRAVGQHFGLFGAGVTAARDSVEVRTPVLGVQVGNTVGASVLGLTVGVRFWPPSIRTPFGGIGFGD